jgi:hypothetical protein
MYFLGQRNELVGSRIRFIERALLSPVSQSVAKAVEYDQVVLSRHGVGFTQDLISFLGDFFDVSDLDDMSLDDLSYLQDLRDQIVVQRQDEFRSTFRRSMGLSYVVDLFESAVFPLQFGEYLGTMNYEVARIVLLMIGDVFSFSLAATVISSCPF